MYELIALKWITKLRQNKNDEVKWNYLDWHTKIHIINTMWIVNEWNDDIEHTRTYTHTYTYKMKRYRENLLVQDR